MWYKIVDKNSDDFKTLFHGNNGSRILVEDTWLEADVRVVHDGTKGTPYLSGWHIIPTKDEALEYIGKFKKRRDDLKIIRVWAKDVWGKKHSPSAIYLARWIYIGARPTCLPTETT